jgi:hypothetical protein
VIDLETNDISILNLALSKRELLLHELDHARLDFLQMSKSEKRLPSDSACAPQRASEGYLVPNAFAR